MTSDRPAAFFVGGHLALDFLNTIATPKDVPVEWLTNGQDLIDWMEQANVIAADVAASFRRTKNHRELDEVAKSSRAFRGWLRGFVTRRMGNALDARAARSLGPLNALLAEDTSYPTVEAAARQHALQLRRVRRWAKPAELLHPIAEAAADLICSEDFQLIRACEGSTCSLLFVDRTKARARRWCSMAVCGNRAKVAAHRARQARN